MHGGPEGNQATPEAYLHRVSLLEEKAIVRIRLIDFQSNAQCQATAAPSFCPASTSHRRSVEPAEGWAGRIAQQVGMSNGTPVQWPQVQLLLHAPFSLDRVHCVGPL